VRIILGIIVILAGFILTWKSEWFFQNFGTIPFFEKYLHSSGGGRFGYKIIGIIATFIGIMILTNLHVRILTRIAQFFTFGAGGA